MPPSANEVLLDLAVRHAVLTERLKGAEARRVARVLQTEVLPDLLARLGGRLQNIATRGFDTGPRTTQRLRYLYRDLRALFDQLAERLKLDQSPRLTRQAKVTAAALAREMAEVSSVRFRAPALGAIQAAVLARPMEGVSLGDRWNGRAAGMRRSIEAQVRIGIVQGEPPEQIISRVRAVWPEERRRVALLVRSAVGHAQIQARQATYEENADLIKGVMWVATLDVSTCPICGELDGQVFPVDEGPRPLAHYGCRCTTVPVLKAARAIGGTRASMDGQVPDKTTFSEWIERQSAERQDEVFGRGRAALWRSGRLELSDMVDAAGHVLSLEKLEEALT